MPTNQDQKDQEAQLKAESEFALQGQQVIKNPAYQQALTVRKAQIFETFCRTKPDQFDIREECYRTMVNMNALEQFFTQALTTGKMADETLESLNKEE